MSLTLMIYLAGVVENISWVLFAILFGLSVAIFVTFLMWTFNAGDGYDSNITLRQTGLKGLKISVASFVILSTITSFIPTKQTMWLMAGAYYGEKAIESEEFKRINEKVFKLIDKKLEELVGEEGEVK